MSRAHDRAIEARLKTLTLSGKQVPAFLGDPPINSPLPYVFITPTPRPAYGESVAGVREFLDQTFTVTFVHTSTNNVLALMEAGQALLDEWTPSAPGWDTSPLEPFDAQPVQTATQAVGADSNTFPCWVVMSYRLQATKE